MKRYLLIAGENYYPLSGTGDWIGVFNTKEEIKIEEVTGWQGKYEINGKRYDWYDIIDLNEWIYEKVENDLYDETE